MLAAVHVALHRAALRPQARIGDLQDQQVGQREMLDHGPVHAVERADGRGLELRRVRVAVEALAIMKIQIEGDPERTGILGPHVAADLADLRHARPP
ncbi:hypothetical protein L963_1446 [Leuconostoc mesenteroides subsp. cremoris T26]|nr:hypothetical protein L963_1446 [Leuconostoc mesenteroides subsp. cremoris T26]